MQTAFWRATFIALFALLIAIVLIQPVAEVGMNDDWSYIKTAQDAAASGHLRYNGWSAPIVGIQAYWGALFIRVFGFSFTICRFSTEVLMALSIPLLLRLFRVAGLDTSSSLFGTLAFALSPVMLPSVTTFMTDTPAFLLFAAAMMAALECWDATDARQAIGWMLLAAALGVLSGSVRQIYWAGSAWFLFVFAVRRFKNTSGRLAACLCLLATIVVAVFVTNWQRAQPYVPAASAESSLDDDVPLAEFLSTGIRYLARFAVAWAVLLLPLTISFAALWRRLRPRWVYLPIVCVAGALSYALAQPLPWVGNTLSQYGVLPSHLVSAGEKPLVLTPFSIWLIATIGIAALASTTLLIFRKRIALSRQSTRFAALTVPFLVVYVAAIAFRGPIYGIYDRYSLPVIAIGAILLLSAYQQLTPKAIPFSCWALLTVFAVYGIATTHDWFSDARARLQAANALLHQGVKRTEILEGFEFDCWTQVEKTGYINNDLIRFPTSAYHDADDCSGGEKLQYFWRSLTPDIQARYVVTVSPLPELPPAVVDQVPYRTWLPWGSRYIYVQRASPPLNCKSE